ncbi:MAG: helix-turn-helix transcriptional regulator [Solirubrobacterales bacterium]|nr:helix-turn-helix transcriptional regulator [Solirubrobacterales bacterium]
MVGERPYDDHRQSGCAAATLSDEEVDRVAARLQLIGHPVRIRLLGLLDGGEATVQQLTDHLPTTHQNVSKHLAALHREGIVARRRDGTRVHYSLADWGGLWLVEQIAAALDPQP